jgi:hypothetical protein
MTAINTVPGLLVPLQGALSGELFAARNPANAGAALPSATVVAGQGGASAASAILTRLASAQGGMAPLLADLSAALARPDLPQAVREAAQTLLSFRLDGTALGGKSLENAVLNSGLFLEAALASGRPGSGDLKSALLSLRTALQATLPTAKAPGLAASLPPPHRSALPTAQPPALPSIAMLDGYDLGAKLLAETDGALARTTLLQLASLPDSGPSRQSETPQRLVVDIPIATPQGNAVIQLQVEQQVEHDRKRENGEEFRAPSWRINLAIDIEPLGPVRASVAQVDGRTHVTMFAEREASARALRNDLPALQAQLAEAALEPGDLHCRSGIPDNEPAPAGLFVDRVS